MILIPFFLPAGAYAQDFKNWSSENFALLSKSVVDNGSFLANASLQISEILDPADHGCCVEPPPETVVVVLDKNGIAITSPDPGHWINFTIPFNPESPLFEGETSSTVAGFDDVRNLFVGELFTNGIILEATLGADGELFGETIVYTLEIDTGEVFTTPAQVTITQTTVEKVKTANGKGTDASFESGASADGGESSTTDFSTEDNITIAGTINIDPAHQGQSGEVFVVLLSINTEGVTLAFLNEDGNYEAWNQTLGGLGPHLATSSLEESYSIPISSGALPAGTYRVALAYSRGSAFVYAPKAIVIKVVD